MLLASNFLIPMDFPRLI